MNDQLLRPHYLRLRVYAFDPILTTKLETSAINEIVVSIPWEVDRKTKKDILQPGPVGEYVEVVDYDPASDCFYESVNLRDPYLLAQDGLPPSESNPQFHQQMVYAVAMLTIHNFERALGRCALWSPRRGVQNGKKNGRFVPRLRIYPHALREANAYYSPGKKALLFGYFPATASAQSEQLPGGVVFASLSHDIIVHETVHALLDGLHPRFIENTNPDVLAFHEAFADIVALFQHFSLPGILYNQIVRTRGDLATENLLAKIAQQFGQAIGNRGALRDALGATDPQTDEWKRSEPDPTLLTSTRKPHARGAILVAAVFAAFVSIYKKRTTDLLRIATGGTGILPEGDIHPDLAGRLADEAATSAKHILKMCIRALDYCPPVDITFGDYLRALITADLDMVPDDRYGYRIAIVEAFRSWGIYPLDVRSLSVESLQWYVPTEYELNMFRNLLPKDASCKDLVSDWEMWSAREKVFQINQRNAIRMHRWISSAKMRKWLSSKHKDSRRTFGLALDKNAPPTVFRGKGGWPSVEIHSVRPAVRTTLDGRAITDLVVEITQRRRGYMDPEDQRKADSAKLKKLPREDFIFRGGTTLLIDAETSTLRYVISKRVCSEARLARQRRFRDPSNYTSLRATYRKYAARQSEREPLAILHRSIGKEGLS